MIAEAAQEAGVSVDFYSDQVKSGGLFNKSVEDCFVMYNPEHKNDYYLICIRVQHQGNLAYVIINDFGSSSQMDKFARSEYAKQDRRGKSLSYKIGSVIGSTVRNLGKNRQKLEEEQRYYDSVQHVLDQVWQYFHTLHIFQRVNKICQPVQVIITVAPLRNQYMTDPYRFSHIR